ncbi:MAG: hypothetical protein JWM98_1428 [Thermoleophilia bacterium]|nr:hypothetical protein [Thermoleophilia bacterium]
MITLRRHALTVLAAALATAVLPAAASAHGLRPPSSPALSPVVQSVVNATPDAVWIAQVRSNLHQHMLGAYLDDLARTRGVQIRLQDPAQLGCGGVGVVACTNAANVGPFEQPSIAIAPYAKGYPQNLVSALLAHELVHVADAAPYGGLWWSLRGDAGIWSETRAYLVQARIESQLGVPSQSWTFGHSGTVLDTPDHVARTLGSSFYYRYYGTGARTYLRLPANVDGDGTVSGWITSWQMPRQAPATAATIPLRAFANPFVDRHWYTNDPGARTGPYGFVDIGREGTLYRDPQPGTVPLRRFSLQTGDKGWFLTADPRYATTPAGWTFEGIQGYCSTEQVKGTVGLVRWRQTNGDHVLSAHGVERARLMRGETLEGVECYVLP